MKKKVMKKALAGMLATTMVLGMSMVALATETTSGSGNGNGEFEGHVEKEVVAVTLPTASATTFAYKMDPEGLIAATENAKYANATFEKGANVYFQSAVNTYTKDSAKLKVINKGTADVDVTIKAEVEDGGAVAMATADTFAADNKNAELYLGLKVADKPAVAVTKMADGGGEKVVGLKGKSDNFEITYDSTSGYGYTPKKGVPETAWNSFEFGLTGACNPNGDYSATGLAASNVTVTWSYAERADDSTADMLSENAVADAAPSIETIEYNVTSGTALPITLNFGAGEKASDGIAKIRNLNTNADVPGARYSLNGNTLTLDDIFITNNMNLVNTANGLKLSVVFKDADNTAVTITLKAAPATTE